MVPPTVPPACRFSCQLVFEASHCEAPEELDWQLQALGVSQDDRSWNWGQGFKKGAREEMRPAAGMKEGRGRSDPGD